MKQNFNEEFKSFCLSKRSLFPKGGINFPLLQVERKTRIAMGQGRSELKKFFMLRSVY